MLKAEDGIISFREQKKRCSKHQRIFLENCKKCGEILKMCKRFGGQCFPRKCELHRIIMMQDIGKE